MQTSNDEFVPEAGHAMAVLEAFSPVFPELGVAEIAQRASLSPPTARRIAATLHGLGYLREGDKPSSYRLGARLLGCSASRAASWARAAHAPLPMPTWRRC